MNRSIFSHKNMHLLKTGVLFCLHIFKMGSADIGKDGHVHTGHSCQLLHLSGNRYAHLNNADFPFFFGHMKKCNRDTNLGISISFSLEYRFFERKSRGNHFSCGRFSDGSRNADEFSPIPPSAICTKILERCQGILHPVKMYIRILLSQIGKVLLREDFFCSMADCHRDKVMSVYFFSPNGHKKCRRAILPGIHYDFFYC